MLNLTNPEAGSRGGGMDHPSYRQSAEINSGGEAQVSAGRPRKLDPMPNSLAVEESHNKWLLNSKSIDNVIEDDDPLAHSSSNYRRPLNAAVNFSSAVTTTPATSPENTSSTKTKSLKPIAPIREPT